MYHGNCRDVDRRIWVAAATFGTQQSTQTRLQRVSRPWKETHWERTPWFTQSLFYTVPESTTIEIWTEMKNAVFLCSWNIRRFESSRAFSTQRSSPEGSLVHERAPDHLQYHHTSRIFLAVSLVALPVIRFDQFSPCDQFLTPEPNLYLECRFGAVLKEEHPPTT